MAFANSDDANKDLTNLIVNYLPQTLSDEEFKQMFESLGPVLSAKIVRDPNTSFSYGYGFVRYQQEEHAKQAISSYNGLQIQNKNIKVSLARAKSDCTKGTNLYLGNLPATMTDEELRALCEQHGTVIQCRVIKDKFTGMGRGIAFVLFAEKSESDAAMKNMTGMMLEGMTTGMVVRYTEDSSKRVKAPPASSITSLAASGYGRNRSSTTFASTRADPYGAAAAAAGYSGYGAVEYPLGSYEEADPYTDPYSGYAADPYGAADYSGYGGYETAVPVVPRGRGRGRGAVGARGRGGRGMSRAVAPYSVMGRPRAVPSLTPGAGVEASEGGYILFVYNIGEQAEEKLLWELFAPYGAVTKVNIIYDFNSEKQTGQKKTKGYGFVTMPNYEEAASAVAELNGYYMNEKALQVSFKKPKA